VKAKIINIIFIEWTEVILKVYEIVNY
jgi:hypothetical protein